ncbi:MAG: hypothetical protein GVY15_02980 [Bacteroidetes bacterium]|jgi:hypothetical protein|nr:hypothetical protein [Bacteroidota bacterium]
MAEAPAAPLNLLKHFPPTPTAEWRARMARDLGDASTAEDLLWEPTPGITLRPFYRTEDLDARRPPLRRSSRSWAVVQPLDAPFSQAAVEDARDGGADALALDGSVSPDGLAGLPPLQASAWDSFLLAADGPSCRLQTA